MRCFDPSFEKNLFTALDSITLNGGKNVFCSVLNLWKWRQKSNVIKSFVEFIVVSKLSIEAQSKWQYAVQWKLKAMPPYPPRIRYLAYPTNWEFSSDHDSGNKFESISYDHDLCKWPAQHLQTLKQAFPVSKFYVIIKYFI